jgi:hypothetical protein
VSLVQFNSVAAQAGRWYFPYGRFLAADTPLKVFATQTGQNDGTPLDSTAGEAYFYVVTVVPLAF